MADHTHETSGTYIEFDLTRIKDSNGFSHIYGGSSITLELVVGANADTSLRVEQWSHPVNELTTFTEEQLREFGEGSVLSGLVKTIEGMTRCQIMGGSYPVVSLL